MLFISPFKKGEWWEFDKEKMKVYNYMVGHNYIDKDSLAQADICEYENWHELYLAKHFCPLEEDVWSRDVWISPDGRFYRGDAHEVQAGYLCEIIYGMDDIDYGGDILESRGWVRATTSLMWDVRFDKWKDKTLTQKQYDALWDWCECHKMKFPNDVNIK